MWSVLGKNIGDIGRNTRVNTIVAAGYNVEDGGRGEVGDKVSHAGWRVAVTGRSICGTWRGAWKDIP
jgi:hypothetical protein